MLPTDEFVRISAKTRSWEIAERKARLMNYPESGFEAIACTNDGLWNMKGDHLAVIIPPAFYADKKGTGREGHL
jgi:hypothetical protein